MSDRNDDAERQDPFQQARAIPKGRTAENQAVLRVTVLNSILMELAAGRIGRGERVRRMAALVGLNDDRPKQLIAWIKGGGGTAPQLALLASELDKDE